MTQLLRHILIRATFSALLVLSLLALDAQAAPASPLTERNMRFTHLDTFTGLSQDTVMDVTQDRYGFIWIATEEGLNRYDGQTVVQFERDPQNNNSLTHNWIWSLLATKDDSLWIGTDGGGINVFNPRTELFTAIRHSANDANSISSDRVRVLHQDSLGAYWVGTVDAGLNRIDPATGRVSRYRHDPQDATSLPSDEVVKIVETRRSGLWIGTLGGGLARFEPATDSFTRYAPTNGASSLEEADVSALYEDRDGQLWVGTRERGLYRLNLETAQLEHFEHDAATPNSLSSNWVRDILQDTDGTLWIATDTGLNEWRSQQGFIHYLAADADASSLSDNRLTDLFQSADGVLWISSYRGINAWNYLSDAFTHYRRSNHMLPEDTVTSIGESSDGALWIATYGGGITRIDRATGKVAHLARDRTKDNTLSSNRVMALYVDHHDQVWAGTRGKGLNRYDPDTGEFKHYRAPELSSDLVSAIYSDPNGAIWVGTFGGGLDRIEANGSITHFKHDTDNPDTLGGNRVLAITRDRSGTLWIGTEDGGLNRYIETSNTFQRFEHDPNDPASLGSNTAWEITETSDGSLWVATKDDGLNQWRAEDRLANRVKFHRWTKADGLISNTVYGLLEDNIGQLWLSSNRGITRMNLATYEMRHYDRRNGLVSDEFNWGARWRSRMGQIIFGGNAGAVAFAPGQVRHNTRVPTAVVTASSPFEQLARAYTGLPPAEPAELLYSDNYVEFEFSALDYTSPDKNEFRFKLEGFDDEWQDPGTTRSIKYANLDAGRYLFRVKVANSDGVWNEDAGSIALQVAPAPWVSPWAFAAYALGAIAILSIAYRIYRARRRREEILRHELETQVAERTSELGERNRELESLNKKLLETSVTDSLTGLYNRRYMDQFIEREIDAVKRECFTKRERSDADFSRYQQELLFFMMIDLDGFKAINDRHGHTAGDHALLQVRDALLGCMRASDTIVRWGGDEFFVVGHTKGIAGIANLAERICLAVQEQVYDLGNGHTGYLSCSVGAVPYPFAPLKPDLLTWQQSLNVADTCTYLVKTNGRNGWLVLSGQESLIEPHAARLPEALVELHEAGEIKWVTSIEEPIELDAKQSAA